MSHLPQGYLITEFASANACRALGLIADKFGLSGGMWDAVSGVSEHFGLLGYLIVGVFVLSWAASMLIYRLKGYDRLELRVATLVSARPAA